MSSLGTGYDLSASQFSPDGRVFQVEYALKAVENRSTTIGLKCKDGVVFGVEKLIQSKLHKSSTNSRVFSVDEHVGMVVGGLLTDAKVVVDRARQEAANYRSQFDSPIPLKLLVERVSLFVHAHTLYSHVRPFGCSIMMGAYDDLKGPELHMIDPSGVSWGYHGCAMGKAKQQAKTELEKVKAAEMTCEELVKVVAKIIYVIHDEIKDKDFDLELSWVGAVTGGHHERVPKPILEEAIKAGKAVLVESDSDGEL